MKNPALKLGGFFLSFLMAANSYAFDDGDLSLHVMEIPPYGYFNEVHEEIGYIYEFAQLAFKEAGFDPSVIKLSPLKRLVRDLNNGGIDCTFLAKTSYVVESFVQIESLDFYLQTAVIAKKGIDLNVYEDLEGLRIASSHGVKIFTRFDNDENLNKIVTNDYRHSVIIFNRDKVDAMTGVLGSLLFNMKELGLDATEMLGKPLIFDKIPFIFVCRKGAYDEGSLEKLRKSVVELRDNGVLIELSKKYLGSTEVNF